jgi:Tfp pilus assembly protein PilZ
LKTDFPQMRFVGLHPQGLPLSVNERMATVVINVPEWTRAESTNLHGLRGAGYSGPVIVMAKPTPSQALSSLRAMAQIVFLEKPFENKDLVGIARKMLSARVVAQRVHRRFNTAEIAAVELYGRSDSYNSRVCNMSKGGAYLEFSNHLPIRVGDMVRMKVELKDVSRIYTVPARVVWTGGTAGRSSAAPKLGVGVEFVGLPDVKKTIFNGY